MLGALAAMAGIGAGTAMISNYDQAAGPLARLSNKTSYKQNAKLAKMQLKYQKRYDKWKSNLDYDMAQRYAENSAKWQMSGLRDAGINPILAVTNSSMGGTFGSPSGGGFSSPNSAKSVGKSDPAAAMSAFAATAKQAQVADKQMEVMEAEKKKILADIDNVNVDTENKRNTNGLSGTPAAVSVIANKLGLDSHSAKSVDTVDTPVTSTNSAKKSFANDAAVQALKHGNFGQFNSIMRDVGKKLEMERQHENFIKSGGKPPRRQSMIHTK